MPLFKLPVATPPPERPEVAKENKKQISIRCLLFFDGTLNNKRNIEGRQEYEKGQKTEASQAYRENRQNPEKEQRLAHGVPSVDLKDDSYENDFSNIVELEKNIEKNQQGYDESVKVYTEGAGTENLSEDKTPGFAFAAGSTGIKTKVKKGVDDAVEQITKGPDKKRKPEDIIIKKLTIDIFGFSRGAASARYCIHQLLQDQQANIHKRLKEAWFDIEEKDIEVRFVGLFDTVSSYYGAQFIKILPLEDWLVKLEAVRLAKKVLHLASAEEHRYHFSLHNIKSAGSKGKEYYLPGTHSDVGGGYLDNASEAGLKVFQGSPYQEVDDRNDYLVTRGWYQAEQLKEEVFRTTEFGDPEFVGLTVAQDKPRVVRNAYCKIPLKIMAKVAGENGIKIISDLENDATAIINDAGLETYESKITADFNAAGQKSSLDTWQKADPKLNTLRHQHLHFSARYNTTFGHNPRRSFFVRKLIKR